MIAINDRQISIAEQMEEGHKLEESFFGLRSIYDSKTVRRGYGGITFQKSLVRTLQAQAEFLWDPKKPKTLPAISLFEAVQLALPKDAKEKLLLCCALGTPLDFFFGIDGFFMISSNAQFLMSFDLARSNCFRKRQRLKANGLITPEDLSNPKRILCIGSIISTQLIIGMSKKWIKPTRERLW
jgi:hypothetical protein